jgi:hypothetical protein
VSRDREARKDLGFNLEALAREFEGCVLYGVLPERRSRFPEGIEFSQLGMFSMWRNIMGQGFICVVLMEEKTLVYFPSPSWRPR